MNSNIQKINVYLDYATIPTLSYLLHFLESYQDTKTIRLFGLARFSIPDTVIQQYPKGIIRFYHIKDHDTAEIDRAFSSLVNDADTKLEVNLHLNLFHSFEMLIPFLKVYLTFQDKFHSLNLHFYDDGSEGAVGLYNLLNYPTETLIESIDFHKEKLSDLIESKHVNYNDLLVLRYLWGCIFNSHYHFLDTNLINHPKLSYLKNELREINKIDINILASLNNTQKDILLDILDINWEDIHHFIELSKKNKSFVFTGTTIFNGNEGKYDILNKIHINALSHFIEKLEGYTVFYKGHPHATLTNKKVKEAFSNISILPDNIPFEILLLLGFKCDLVGGFIGTSYFNFEKENISDCIFIMNKENNDDVYLFNMQHKLSKVLLALNYINEDKIHYFHEFL